MFHLLLIAIADQAVFCQVEIHGIASFIQVIGSLR